MNEKLEEDGLTSKTKSKICTTDISKKVKKSKKKPEKEKKPTAGPVFLKKGSFRKSMDKITKFSPKKHPPPKDELVNSIDAEAVVDSSRVDEKIRGKPRNLSIKPKPCNLIDNKSGRLLVRQKNISISTTTLFESNVDGVLTENSDVESNRSGSAKSSLENISKILSKGFESKTYSLDTLSRADSKDSGCSFEALEDSGVSEEASENSTTDSKSSSRKSSMIKLDKLKKVKNKIHSVNDKSLELGHFAGEKNSTVKKLEHLIMQELQKNNHKSELSAFQTNASSDIFRIRNKNRIRKANFSHMSSNKYFRSQRKPNYKTRHFGNPRRSVVVKSSSKRPKFRKAKDLKNQRCITTRRLTTAIYKMLEEARLVEEASSFQNEEGKTFLRFVLYALFCVFVVAHYNLKCS